MGLPFCPQYLCRYTHLAGSPTLGQARSSWGCMELAAPRHLSTQPLGTRTHMGTTEPSLHPESPHRAVPWTDGRVTEDKAKTLPLHRVPLLPEARGTLHKQNGP